ncbi:MAG: hypothetical protein ACK56I_35845, partial [bacterium]
HRKLLAVRYKVACIDAPTLAITLAPLTSVLYLDVLPRWVDQAETPVVMHGGHLPSRGRPWFRARGFGGGRFRRASGGSRGGGYF